MENAISVFRMIETVNPEYVVDQETLVWTVGEGLKSINQPNYFK